ncbi:MAG: response regulator transcription factor [Bacteroidales bacterium]
MVAEKKIAIVTSCALCGYGLKQLLAEYFSQGNCRVFHSVEPFIHQPSDSFDLYFITPEPVLLNYDYFLPRRNKTVILTDHADAGNGFMTLALHADLSNLIDALQEIFEKIMKSAKKETQEELSSREIEVLKLITRGLINKEIADELCISLNTVLTHRKNITSKLGIKTVSGLTFYAMMNGYTD